MYFPVGRNMCCKWLHFVGTSVSHRVRTHLGCYELQLHTWRQIKDAHRNAPCGGGRATAKGGKKAAPERRTNAKRIVELGSDHKQKIQGLPPCLGVGLRVSQRTLTTCRLCCFPARGAGGIGSVSCCAFCHVEEWRRRCLRLCRARSGTVVRRSRSGTLRNPRSFTALACILPPCAARRGRT